MHAFLSSAGMVALAELGDKTQLLVILLAARYRRPWPILLGVFAATVLLQAMAVAVGDLAGLWLSARTLQIVAGLALLAVALWSLRAEEEHADAPAASSHGLFLTAGSAFFLAEMGDKSQLATIAMALRYHQWLAVLAGAVAGEMLVLAPTVLLGHRLGERIPEIWIRRTAALVFALIGLYLLLSALRS